MNKNIFLFLIPMLLMQNAFADIQFNGTCLQYNGSECIKVHYCASPSLNGCNLYETCIWGDNKFICTQDGKDEDKTIYRDKEFIDTQYRNIFKETYTSPIVEEYNHKPISDKLFPSRENSSYKRDMTQINSNSKIINAPKYIQEIEFQKPFNSIENKKLKRFPRTWSRFF